MSPPPGSGVPRRALSPAKRPRLDSVAAADDDDEEALGSSSRLSVLTGSSRRLSTAPSLTASAAASTRRSTSPTKNVQDLLYFQKPVRYVEMRDNALEQLPEDVRELYTEMYKIGQLESFIPAEVRPDVRAIVGETYFRGRWFKEPATTLSPEQAFVAASARKLVASGQRTAKPTTPEGFALCELDTLRDIEEAARHSSSTSASEAAWNTRVHVPLLVHATTGFRAVHVEPATTAQIARGAMPPTTRNDGRDVSQGKMIDIAVVLRPGADTPLAAAIHAALGAMPPAGSGPDSSFESVNQTMYTPLRFCPTAVSVETKTLSADVEAGRVQLGVWVAAWHRRMEAFRTPASAGVSIVTLPLLLITGHDWKLMFACDRGDAIEIVGGVDIGNTSGLVDLYRLVAVLRAVARWVQGPYARWMEELFLG